MAAIMQGNKNVKTIAPIPLEFFSSFSYIFYNKKFLKKDEERERERESESEVYHACPS